MRIVPGWVSAIIVVLLVAFLAWELVVLYAPERVARKVTPRGWWQ